MLTGRIQVKDLDCEYVEATAQLKAHTEVLEAALAAVAEAAREESEQTQNQTKDSLGGNPAGALSADPMW